MSYLLGKAKDFSILLDSSRVFKVDITQNITLDTILIIEKEKVITLQDRTRAGYTIVLQHNPFFGLALEQIINFNQDITLIATPKLLQNWVSPITHVAFYNNELLYFVTPESLWKTQ